MLSKILNLKDVQELNKKQQVSINGGTILYPIGCSRRRDCFEVTGEFGWACINRICVAL
ncbi:hypothetical protein [Aquimarina sp. AU474]|uniref:hypothetical protein n=1 Tax=Aquimarina sp. AU474 TaxID=2108529 RepID=UPI001358556A|nr:hypothetical protein [Aquimarina sp. AU474]